MLLGHRYYDSSTGRFLTRDPAKDGRNWYGYCAGNPSSYHDGQGQSRITVLYGLVERETGQIMKWGITYYPKSRYRTWWLRKFGLEVKEIAYYESRAHARLDERVLESEMPGPMNNTPWAKEAKRMGFSAGVTAATASSALADYEATINKNKADFSVFTYIPNALGVVIAGAQALGEWANNWGAEWRKARFDLGERILDVE